MAKTSKQYAWVVEDYLPLSDLSQILSEDLKRDIDRYVVESPKLFNTWEETELTIKTVFIVYPTKPMEIYQTFLTKAEMSSVELVKEKKLHPVLEFNYKVESKIHAIKSEVSINRFVPLSDYTNL